MDIFQYIPQRKTVRKYKDSLLDEEILQKIRDFIEQLTPLCPEIKTECRLVGKEEVKGILAIRAPHYLMIYSENKPMYLENCGFMYQQANLFLSGLGLGGGWVGLAKPASASNKGLEFVIFQTCGQPAESPHRTLADFSRKPIEKIANGEDPRLESARLAPSALNSQPWYFLCSDGDVHVYRQKIGALKKTFGMETFNRIDIGIALCHFWLAGKHLGMDFSFDWENPIDMKELPGYHKVGIIRKGN